MDISKQSLPTLVAHSNIVAMQLMFFEYYILLLYYVVAALYVNKKVKKLKCIDNMLSYQSTAKI